jgi:hypothetical protein
MDTDRPGLRGPVSHDPGTRELDFREDGRSDCAMVGTIYAVSVAVLALLLGFASRERHENLGDREVFRFPKALKIALMIGAPVPGALGMAIWPTFGASRGILEASFLALIFGSLSLIVAASYVQTVRFVVSIGRDQLMLRSWWHTTTIRLADVARIVVLWPWRGRGYVELFNLVGKKLCRLDAGLEDFEDLVGLIQQRCPEGTRVRERDTDGKWTEWATTPASKP